MFNKCSSLTHLDLSNFYTNNLNDMNNMFNNCDSLIKLNLSNFNTSKIKDMSHMFEKNSSLINLDLSNFNTNKVVDMSYMFYKCSSLKKLNLKNCISCFNMNYIFYGVNKKCQLLSNDTKILSKFEYFIRKNNII
jgi:surface protein